MDRIKINVVSPIADSRALSTRRIFCALERRYISQDVQSMILCILNSGSVTMETIENAIQQAVMFGSLNDVEVDVSTFETILDAICINPSFGVPFSVGSMAQSSDTWVC